MAKIEIDFPEITKVSFSRIKLWRTCQMAHHYKYYQRLIRRRGIIPLIVGTAIHSVIEAHLKGQDVNAQFSKFRKEYDKLFNEEKAEVGDLPGNIERIMGNYFERYSNDNLIYPVRRRGTNCELPMVVDLPKNIQWIGYIDAYPQDERGRNWMMDHKSCKTVPDEETRYSDLQLLVYCWLLPQLDYPVPDGIIWDYIRTKPPAIPEVLKGGGISKSSKIDTTYETYMETVIKELGEDKAQDYEEFAATNFKVKEDRFLRRIYLPHPGKEMVKTVVNDMMASAYEISLRGPTATVRSMTRDCKRCSYYNLCQTEARGLDSTYIRKNEYTIKGEDDVKEESKQFTPETGD